MAKFYIGMDIEATAEVEASSIKEAQEIAGRSIKSLHLSELENVTVWGWTINGSTEEP